MTIGTIEPSWRWTQMAAGTLLLATQTLQTGCGGPGASAGVYAEVRAMLHRKRRH